VRLSSSISSSSFPPCASSPQPALSALNAAAKPVHTVRSACKLMEATADRAQDLIFELVRDKCDELLNIQGIEWEPLVAPEGPRPEVLDLVAYLRVTFMCLTYLPTTTREAVHFASLAHVHTSLRTELLDTHSAVTSLQEGGPGEASQHSVSHASRCTRVNALSLYALKLDVAALEAFADECGVPQLRACFRPLRQLLDALLDKRASTLLADEATRATLFPQLDAEDAIVVLEKVAGVAGNGSSAKRWGSSSSSSSSGGGGGSVRFRAWTVRISKVNRVSKVAHFCSASTVQQDVGALEVAVQHSVRVQVGHGRGHVTRDASGGGAEEEESRRNR